MIKTLLQLPATKNYGALLISAEVKNKVAYLSIDGYISRWGDASTTNLKNEVKTLTTEGATTAEVYINTEGGDCFQATEMCNILDDAFGNENVSLKVGALAASAGTKILVHYSKNASCKKNSRFMIHKPSMHMGGNEDKVKSQLKLLKNLTAEYKTAYASTFGISEEEVEKLWVNDYWMDAQEAKKKNMVAFIEDETAPIDSATRLKFVAAGDPNPPTTKTKKNPKIDTMNKEVLAASLGLPTTATEAEINAKIAENKAKAETADGLQATLDAQATASTTAKITALLDKGEAAKKFTGDQRPNLQLMAEGNLEATEKFIEAMLPVTAINIVPAANTPGATGADPDTKEWKYEDYAKAGAKGSNLLAKLEIEDLTAYNAIIAEAMPETNPS
jgi:ATP-dependent Clp protease protease subunit